MKKRPHSYKNSEAEEEAPIPVSDLSLYKEDWLLDCDIRQLSKNTVANYRFLMDKLLWYLNEEKMDTCGLRELKRFFAYVNTAHETEAGRWGNPRMKKPVSALTVATYHTNLRSFFNYLIAEGITEINPVERINRIAHRDDQILPFTEEQVQALFEAAKRSKDPKRNIALLWFLFDTGARVSEAASVKAGHVDFNSQQIRVLGKGNKKRTLPFGNKTKKALWDYIRSEPHEDDEALFLAHRGVNAGDHLTRSGVQQIIERLGADAKIEHERCSPHTFRHTFAIEYLRNGGDAFSLKELLGHTTLTMTNKYILMAQADIKAKHRRFSPGDNFGRRKE